MKHVVVVTTVGSEEQGNLIAYELVARRHAACVNIVPGIRSFYRWQGEVCRDSELMLVIKTSHEEFDRVVATIHELHEYELPEILAFDISQGDRGFLDWMTASLEQTTPVDDGTNKKTS